jgi:hypothetical protein
MHMPGVGVTYGSPISPPEKNRFPSWIRTRLSGRCGAAIARAAARREQHGPTTLDALNVQTFVWTA